MLPNETLALFQGKVKLEADPQFGYKAMIMDDKSHFAIAKGVGSSPHLAIIDLLNQWEKG